MRLPLGKRFFESLAEEFGRLPFIAEELGIITPEVNNLKRIFGFLGMKVLQFTSIQDAISEGDMNFVFTPVPMTMTLCWGGIHQRTLSS